MKLPPMVNTICADTKLAFCRYKTMAESMHIRPGNKKAGPNLHNDLLLSLLLPIQDCYFCLYHCLLFSASAIFASVSSLMAWRSSVRYGEWATLAQA